jgi:NAD(P)-dependent dehydrogenase (short-subunit alcohol dehydrogenase family)
VTTFVKCDLGDWHASANAAKEVSSRINRLDILVLNSAGES